MASFEASSPPEPQKSPRKFNYKIILLGDVGVGKTSLFNRIRTGEFIEDYDSGTSYYDNIYYTTTVGDDEVNVSCCSLIV